MTHFSREVSWPDSEPHNNSYTLNSSSASDSDSTDGDPDFVIPRQGPRLFFDEEFTAMQRINWQSTLVGALIDKKPIPSTHMHELIQKAWSLQGAVQVRGKAGPNYIFEFTNAEDMQFMIDEGPWAVQNKLLVLDYWTPNLILQEHRVTECPLWIQIWGLPLEYQNSANATCIGSLVGHSMHVDFTDQGIRNLRYLRVQMTVNPHEPLLMGFYAQLDDGRTIWIQLRYERVFRICMKCGCIGHINRDCRKGRAEIQHAIDIQKAEFRRRFHCTSLVDHSHPLYTSEAAAFLQKKQRRTTKIRYKPAEEGHRYFTHEFDECKFRRDATKSQSSSSVNNRFHLSDDSDDANSSAQTPTAILPQSHSEPSHASAVPVPDNTPTSLYPHSHPKDTDMVDVMMDPFFGDHGADFIASTLPTGAADFSHYQSHLGDQQGQSSPQHLTDTNDPVVPINPLAQQSKLVSKLDALPASTPHFSAAIFWHKVSEHFQCYDEFFTSVHTIATSWTRIPFQKSWLTHDPLWQAVVDNNASCLGMLVVNTHNQKGYWELLEMAPSVTPRFFYHNSSLLYKPTCNSPFLLSPFN